jgi:molybdopterin molybdotransferase
MLEFEEALQRILSSVRQLDAERVSLHDAVGRVLAEPIVSPVDLPLFDNSAMDGYAVRAVDLQGASGENPRPLRLIGKVAAGEVFAGTVEAGTCLRLFTGSPLPRGADAVIMQEDTRPDPIKADLVWFLDTIKPWENIRLQGEDMKRDVKLAEARQRLSVGRAGLLAASGLTEVQVTRQPRVALLSTGSELMEGGRPLSPGKIYESNRVMLASLVERAGATARILPLVPDRLEATRAALEAALEGCDAVVTSGGVSMGDYDFVKSAFEKLGGELAFWKISIRPGKPFVFGRAEKKCLFGLPGNPVSAFVTCLLLVRPALAAMQGARETNLARSPGVLAEPLTNQGDRRHFLRVTIDDAGHVRSAGAQASHSLSSLAEANGLVDLPPRTSLKAGATVSVLQWDR